MRRSRVSASRSGRQRDLRAGARTRAARALRRRGPRADPRARSEPGRVRRSHRAARRPARIVWMNNTFRNTRTFEETYRNDAIGAIASRVIDDFQPDVAHVHHLTVSLDDHRAIARRAPHSLLPHASRLLADLPSGAAARRQLSRVRRPDPRRVPRLSRSRGRRGRARLRRQPRTSARSNGVCRRPPRAQLRRVAERLPPWCRARDEAQDQERRRIEHMREVCADVTHFLAPSRYMRDRFVQFGVRAERITVSPDTASITHANPAEAGSHARCRSGHAFVGPPSAGPLRLGFLGSLMVSKAPHVLLEAFGRLAGGAVSVDLFGGSRDLSR